ncbi:MAG TPA: SDR family oxidoreductase [Chloroflexota bacterium]
MRSEDRICLVVGGVRTIGRVIATTLAEAGATVVVSTSRTPVPHSPFPAIHLDVLDLSSVEEAMDYLAEEYSRLDVLIYNSGLPGPSKSIDEVSDEEWEEVFAVNVTGFFRLCRSSLPLLRRSREGGRIIAISSMTGRRPLLHRAPYAATKLALTGFVRSLALEVGPDDITVNTVSPGYVEGERLGRVIENQAEAHGVTVVEMHNRFVAHSPVGRFVAPESVARAVLFLADPTASDITGTDINVTAGVWMD